MIILLFSLLILVVGVFGFKILKKDQNKDETTTPILSDCCGAHEICEKDSLLIHKDEIIYYNDEELDEFVNKKNYTDQDIQLFKEVFYTLKEEEVAGWLCSLQLRNIQLPENLKDEALFIVSERRKMI